MFGRDPAKALAKARRQLAAGDPLAALRTAEKARRRARPPVSAELAELERQAHRAVVDDAVAKAEASAAEGWLDDAAEWLRGAVAHAEDDAERERLERRRVELVARAEAEAEAEAGSIGGMDEEAPGVTIFGGDAGEGPALPPEEELYAAWVGSLRDDVAPHYEGRPSAFRTALIDLADPDHAEAAAATIEELAAAAPGDPALALERGRWRLARGESAAARADFETAWQAFGDRPIDLSERVSIPEMWCQAALAAGDAAAVRARLEEHDQLTRSDPELSLHLAEALLADGEDARAAELLAEALGRFPGRADLAHLLALTLRRTGNAAGAAEVLEGSVRSCGAGCSSRALHPPSLRLLAEIYAENGGPLERLENALLLLRGAQGGRLGPDDWRLQARYHELAGEPDAAARARARARAGAGQAAAEAAG